MVMASRSRRTGSVGGRKRKSAHREACEALIDVALSGVSSDSASLVAVSEPVTAASSVGVVAAEVAGSVGVGASGELLGLLSADSLPDELGSQQGCALVVDEHAGGSLVAVRGNGPAFSLSGGPEVLEPVGAAHGPTLARFGDVVGGLVAGSLSDAPTGLETGLAEVSGFGGASGLDGVFDSVGMQRLVERVIEIDGVLFT